MHVAIGDKKSMSLTCRAQHHRQESNCTFIENLRPSLGLTYYEMSCEIPYSQKA